MPTFDKLMCKTLLKLGYPRFDDVVHTERKAEVVQACCRFSVDENKLGCRGDKRPIGVRAKSPRSDIVMGFGTELQGLNSHESLVQLQDTEIRVLENIRKCLTLRIKCDRDYAAQLSQMVGSAQRLEVAKDYETPVYQTWVAMVKETEVFAHNIKTNADKLHTRTLDKLVQIINEKKSARKIYSDEKARLENEYNKLHSEVERLKLEYEKLVNKVNQDKAKYDEVLTKGKGGSKLESAKQKYIQTESRLQKVHNDYITTLTETGLHHKMYVRTTLPGLLDHQQEVQETLVTQCKDVLQDYSELTNTSRDPFANCHQQISKHINGIHPSGEYDDFLISKRSDALIAKKYGYSTGLLNKYQGTLKEDDVALNHITVENLKHSRSSYEDSLAKCREKMTVKRKRLNELENEVERNVPNDDHDDVVKLSYYKSRRELSLARRELTELGCIEEKFKELQSMVDEPLKSLVGNDVPPGIMFDPSEENKDDTGSMSSQSSKEKKAKPFDSIKSALSQKLNRRHQSGNPPKPPSRDFVDTKVNGEEESAGAASVSSDAEKGSAAMSDGYQQMTVHPNRQLDEEEWFHGVLPRDEVQRLLVNDGDYLVRESVNRKTQETQYVLSVQWQGHKHFIIQGSEETGWRFEGDSYPTIQELIIHQHKSGVPVTKKSEAILSKPVLQEEWELRNDDITLGQKIGNGNFGDVYRGIFKPKDLQVAVKTCRETLSDDAKKKFLQEGRILKQFMHPNIVEFIGIGAQKQPVMIVMEYVPGGALLNFLRKKGQDQTTKTLVGMSVDAAFGMEYLEERNCIHRDLAARNCLVGKENVVKISDFGMSREEEEYTVSGGLKQIPIKWTAPEALNYGRYTSASDVWSFGILMWEIYSFGAVPYPGMTNQQAKEKVDEGYRLPAPEGTPEKAYTVMMKCWEKEDKDRSKFGELHSELKAFHSTL